MLDSSARGEPKLPRPIALGLLLSWCAVLMVSTINPDTAITNPLFPGVDKLAHLLGWFVLGGLATLLVDEGAEQFAVWIACCLFGLLTELGQIPIPRRNFEWFDGLADAIGAGIGTLVSCRYGFDPPAAEPSD